MINLPTIWIISGIVSCLIFTLSERDLIRNIEFTNALMVVLYYIVFCIFGPIGLIMTLLALLITFLANL